ncbi:MAG: acetyltransferase [Clostridiales bacterium]|nr:acetyltransferase [Clostridiales bacterium]
MQKPIIILGAGGHAKVLIDALQYQSANILGVTDPDPELHGKDVMGIPIIGDDNSILQYGVNDIMLVNGMGKVNCSNKRMQIYQTFKERGYIFAKVIHPSAVISTGVYLAEGVHIMAGAIIQTLATIGVNTIINTRASIDHECIIGDHVHIAPGATISGGVEIGDNVLIGAGATIIQGIHVGASSVVGAGAVVTKDVREGVTVMGIPARVVSA